VVDMSPWRWETFNSHQIKLTPLPISKPLSGSESSQRRRGCRNRSGACRVGRPHRTGELEVPIAGVFALDDVRDAFRQVELRHTRGKLVLRP